MDNTHHTGAVLRNVVVLNRLPQGGSRRYASPTMAPRRPGGGRVRTAQGRRPSAVERTGRHAPYARRNLIDDYFGLGEEICYRDFDLLAMGPVVSQPVNTATGTTTAGQGERPGGTASQERVMTATITGIDKNASSITFTGPNGWKYSRRVVDPTGLEKLKVGDQVDITWDTSVTVAVQ